MTPPNEFDRALANLPAVADNGFSAAVSARIALRQEFQRNMLLLAVAAAAGMVLFFMPLDELNAAVGRIAADLSNSPPVAIALGMLVLCGLYLRTAEAE
ncbi:MAG TPA: hypothetical protein VGF56_12760 [Rhizomicrobium sp.]|jgi:hypothetical protein